MRLYSNVCCRPWPETSESNALFEQWLKALDPESGIKNFEMLEDVAAKAWMKLKKDNVLLIACSRTQRDRP